MEERKFDDFDEHAATYREIHTKNVRLSGADSFYFAEMKAKLLCEFEKDIPLNVLDVGCGDGATEVFFKKYFPSWKVTGIDISEKSIDEAKSKNINGTIFKLYDGTSIASADGQYDIIFMAGVLHHVHFKLHPALLKEVNRVLKKKGRFYLFEHNPFNPFTRHLVNTCVFDKDAKLLTAKYTRVALMAQNFRILKKSYIIFFPRKWVLSNLIFLEKYLQWLPLGGQYFFVAQKY